MTEQEFDKILRGIKGAYPSWGVTEDTKLVWYRFLQDKEYSVVELAVAKHITSCKFAPTISEILDQCVAMMIPETANWLDGWQQLQRVMSRYGYNRPVEAIAELKKRDPLAGRVAENLGWQNLCMSETQAADRANFRQAYETLLNREKDHVKIPAGLYSKLNRLTANVSKQMIEGTTQIR